MISYHVVQTEAYTLEDGANLFQFIEKIQNRWKRAGMSKILILK